MNSKTPNIPSWQTRSEFLKATKTIRKLRQTILDLAPKKMIVSPEDNSVISCHPVLTPEQEETLERVDALIEHLHKVYFGTHSSS